MQRNKKTIRKGYRQKAWQYMRRNPMFAIKDILLILDGMSERSLMLLVRQLNNDDYLRPIKRDKVFRERSYKLVKNTGIVCPAWMVHQSKLFDANINAFGMKSREEKLVSPEYVPKEAKSIEQRPVSALDYAKGRIMTILNTCETDINYTELRERSGVSDMIFGMHMQALQKDKKLFIAGCRVRKVAIDD